MYFYLTRSRFHSCVILAIFLILCGYPSYTTRISVTRPGDSLDVFTVQRTNCNDWCLSKQSQLYNTSCTCRCNSNASTFVYKVNLKNSTCVDNVKIRQTLADQCKVLLAPNDRNSPLSVLDLSKSGSKVLTGINGSSVCSVVKEQFLENGIWVTGNLTTFTTQNSSLKWSSVTVPPYAGRIVKVDINCGANQSCVIFKVQGTFSYNVSTDYKSDGSTSISLQPSPTVHLGSTQTSTALQVKYSTSRHYKAKNTIPLEPATISPTLATVAMVTSSAILIDTGGRKTVLDRCERGAWVFCKRVYLVIAAAGSVVLVVVGIILISFACIRRRRNLHHQKPVFSKSGLTKETDSSTELALIEVVKPVNEDYSGQNTVEALYQNVPKREKTDKNQLYRPLRSSDGQDSPTSPISQGRFSSASSTNDETSYDDNTDSNELIKPQPGSKRRLQFKTFCPSPVIHSKKDFVSKQAVLDVEEEEEEDQTYEIMEKKTILPHGKTTQDDTEGMTGIENQVFEDDDKRQSHYEGITTDETDEQPNYENLGEDLEYSEEQPDYETMEENLHGQLNANDLSDEEQVNYKTMEDCSDVKQPNDQHKTALLYKQMRSHNKNWDTDNDNKKDEEMEYEQQYDIPEINEDVSDRNYDIPELSVDIQEEQDEPDYHYVLNKGTGLTVPSNKKPDDDDDNDTDYIYANVPETQANVLREKLKLRNSWLSSGQLGDEGEKLETQAADEKPGVGKSPTSRNDSRDGKKNEVPKTHEEDEEELYTLPDDYPKALPSCLLKGRSSPQMKDQASPKQRQKSAPLNGARQAVDQDKPKTKGTKQNRGVIPDRTRPDSPKITGKIPAKSYSAPGGRAKEHLKHFKEGRISPESMAVKKGKNTSDHLDAGKKDKALKNKEKEELPKSNGGTPSPRQTNSRGKDEPTRRKQQPKNKNKTSVAPQNEKENHKSTKWNQNENEDSKITENEKVNKLKENHVDSPASTEQPLYTNILEMQKEAQLLANHNADFMEDVSTGEDVTDNQQPLYENLS